MTGISQEISTEDFAIEVCLRIAFLAHKEIKFNINNGINHKNYNFLDCDWFKKLLFSHLFSCQVVIGQFVIGHLVIGQFVIGQSNKPITFKVVV